jgi:hypothetical protein
MSLRLSLLGCAAFAGTALLVSAPGFGQAAAPSGAGPAPVLVASLAGVSSSSEASAAALPQYGDSGNGSYGRYHYHNHESHLAFEASGGFNAPIGNTPRFSSWGGNVTVGAGWKFNQHFELLGEFSFLDNKLPGRLISQVGTDGGNSHIFALTAEPVFYAFSRQSRGNVYVIGGGGYYHKSMNFTNEVPFCDYFYGCGLTPVTVGSVSNNQGGLNLGVGFTYKIGNSESNPKLFAEARYLWIDSPSFVIGDAPGVAVGTTSLMPVTFGIRW